MKYIFIYSFKHLKHANYLVGNDGDVVVVVGVVDVEHVGDVGDVGVGGYVEDYELLEHNTGLDGENDDCTHLKSPLI